MRGATLHAGVLNIHLSLRKSVVVADFNVIRITIFKSETDSPLIIDCDRILALSLTLQRVKSVTWWTPEVVQPRGEIDVLEFTRSSLRDIRRKPLGLARLVERLRPTISKRLYHG